MRRAVAFGSGSSVPDPRKNRSSWCSVFRSLQADSNVRSFGMKLCTVLFWGLLQISALSRRGDLQEIVLFGSVLVYVAF